RTTDISPVSGRHFPTQLALIVLFLAALWFVLCKQLSSEWSVNEQYSFGWFVPFFALYLFWLRWQDRPPPQIPKLVLSDSRMDPKSQARNNGFAALIAIPALLLLLPVRVFEIANPEWRLLAWVHTVSVVTLTLLLIWRTGGSTWLRHFAFP